MKRLYLTALLCLLTSASCATATGPSSAKGRLLTPREREQRLQAAIEKNRELQRQELDRLVQQTRKGGRDFLVRQEREARLRSIEIYRSLLNTYPDNTSSYMAEASFRYAELLFENERERIRTILETKGETATIEPDFTEAIRAYEHVIGKYPEHPLTEDALYGLAYCYTEQGEPDRAADGYARLIKSFPGTRYSVEINMRLGEYFFNMEDLPRAIGHYDAVAESGEPEYVEKALYKLGWCYYNLDRYEDAINSFFAALDLAPGPGRSINSLADESMDIIARSYTESGGTPAFIRRIRNRPGDPYSGIILFKIAELYKDRSLFPEAIGTYRTYMERFPSGVNMPEVLNHIRETYHVRGDTLASIEISENFSRYIGPGTAWYENADNPGREQAIALILENLETAANRRRGRSQAAGRETELAMALQDLDNFEMIAGGGIPCRIRFLMGITMTELDIYPEAVHVLDGMAGEESCRDLARQAVVASADYQINTYNGSGRVDLPLFGSTVTALLEIAPGSDVTPAALLALGEITMNKGDLPGARSGFSTLIKRFPDSGEAGRARILTARTYFKEADYERAAAWFLESWERAKVETTREEALRLHVYSLFKRAEELSDQDNKTEAAERFEAIYRKYPGSDVAQVSLYNAGKLFKAAGRDRKATSLFETLAETYTDSEYANEALQMSVLILEALGDPVRAADDSMVIASRSRGEQRRTALLKAADLYSAGDEPGRASSTRKLYIAEFSRPGEELSRQLYLLGRDLEATGDWKNAQDAYKRSVALQAEAGDDGVITAFAAKSRLRIAEKSFSAYIAYHIAPPIDQTVVRKREMLQEVIREFVSAGSYRTADVITAANYYIGRALELFKEDILSSPRPAGFSDAEREEYDLLLQEMAFPFESKALDAYRVNIQRSVKLELLDPWIEKTFERMAELAPWSYRRYESIAYPSSLIVPTPLALPPVSAHGDSGTRRGSGETGSEESM